MATDLYSIVESCKRTLNVVESIGEQCDWIKANIDAPHLGSGADFNKMLNLIVDAAEVTDMTDQLRADLNSYLEPYDHDYARLGLNSAQIDVVKAFLVMTDKRPFKVFSELYRDLGRPERVKPRVEMPEAAGVTI